MLILTLSRSVLETYLGHIYPNLAVHTMYIVFVQRFREDLVLALALII